MSNRFVFLCFAGGIALLMPSAVLSAEKSFAARVEGAAEGAVVRVEQGTLDEPLKLRRSVTLRGDSAEECILSVTADEPALSVTDKATVIIDSMTIRWRLASSEPQPGPASAVFVKDANLTLRNCRLVADGNGTRCPSALLADGFSTVRLENCRFDGFEFAVNISGGAEGTVTDCVFLRPGHCGITVFSGSTLAVRRTIVAHSAFHGLRATGGKLTASENLILKNRNRGIYLGNKSAEADVSGNVILGNGTGISCFAQTEGAITHNVIADSEYAAIDSRDTCSVSIADNILAGNSRGFVLFEESGRNRVALKSNTFWENQTDAENTELPDDALLADPQFAAPDQGKFGVASDAVQAAGHGLTDAAPVAKLWEKWKALESEPSRN